MGVRGTPGTARDDGRDADLEQQQQQVALDAEGVLPGGEPGVHQEAEQLQVPLPAADAQAQQEHERVERFVQVLVSSGREVKKEERLGSISAVFLAYEGQL